jgi:hypothetical protein
MNPIEPTAPVKKCKWIAWHRRSVYTTTAIWMAVRWVKSALGGPFYPNVIPATIGRTTRFADSKVLGLQRLTEPRRSSFLYDPFSITVKV